MPLASARAMKRALLPLPIAAHQVTHLERLALFGVQRFGQPPRRDDEEGRADRRQKPEHGMPAGVHEQKAPHQRRHGRRHAEEDGHLRHHALRLVRRVHVADDRARHHHAGTDREALQGAKEDQLPDRCGQRAAHRGQREQGDARQHHRPAAETVGQRAVEQVHRGKAEQVGRQRLLHLHRRGGERTGDAAEGRQVGVDRKRPEHAQAGQQQRQGPARAGPELGRVGVHRLFDGRPKKCEASR